MLILIHIITCIIFVPLFTHRWYTFERISVFVLSLVGLTPFLAVPLFIILYRSVNLKYKPTSRP